MKHALILLSVALIVGCGPSPEGCEDCGTCGDAGRPTTAPHTHRWVPYVDGAFTRVFRPSTTRYLNDHTLIRGPDQRWHLYGITHDSTGMPHAERSLLHATATALDGPWREEPDILMSMGDERVLWAPFVLPIETNRWAMYFWAGTPDNRTQRADSTDLLRWTRDPRSVVPPRPTPS